MKVLSQLTNKMPSNEKRSVAILWLNQLGPFIGLALVVGVFAALVPAGVMPESFLTSRNVETILRQTTIVGIASLGMTAVIVSAGIDLSVGSIIALSTVVIAIFLNQGVGPFWAGVGGIGVGAFCGWINGTLITRLKVVPFIVTLGMLLIVRGAAKGLAGQQRVEAPITWLGELLATLPAERKWMLLPPGVWIFFGLAIAFAMLLRYTRLGRHIFAIGSSEPAARLCGVAVERVKVLVYLMAGGLAGLSGLMQYSRLTVGDPSVATGLELDVIAAVVIGGGSLSGGEGSVAGTVVGALIMTTIRAGCSQMGLPNWIQEILTGTIIVVAVALDRWRHRNRDS
jgi:ribose transport system permease protein